MQDYEEGYTEGEVEEIAPDVEREDNQKVRDTAPLQNNLLSKIARFLQPSSYQPVTSIAHHAPREHRPLFTFAAREAKPRVEIAPDTRSAIEKMRDTVADMDEDYKNFGERVMGFFMLFVGYVVPFVMMYAVANTVATLFRDGSSIILSLLISYGLEASIAALTVALGRSFEEIQTGKKSIAGIAIVFIPWIILNGSSAGILYIVYTRGGNVANGSIEQLIVVLRVTAIALADLGCSVVLMFRGRSLQKHIDSIRKRASAISDLADAQRAIEESDKNAALREQMMKATLKIQDEMSQKIAQSVEMVMNSVLHDMERSLDISKKDDSKNGRHYGR